MIEQELVKDVVDRKPESLLKLQHYYALKGRSFFAERISEKINLIRRTPNKEDDIIDTTIRYVLNACPRCASLKTEVINFDDRWRDGDIVCSVCREHVRMFDAG